MARNITKHFTLEEFERSSTAASNGVRNTLPTVYYPNVVKLCETLELARDVLGMPIRINSGYRCARLNKLVSGAPNSYHLYGRAADLSCDDMQSLFEILNGLPHVELIYHYPTYIHFAV